mmetsp:Transcript_25667/g.67822  ORF Transcript_25667/g.67822 Transcript_25667/m.67822 type:complete len:274 (-) Transcript_25667:616-1437(-)
MPHANHGTVHGGEMPHGSSGPGVQALDRYLLKPTKTKRRLLEHFRKHAAAFTREGRPALSRKQAAEMVPAVTAALGVPSWLFDDVGELFFRFDFNGDDLLDEDEYTKMYRAVLRERRAELAGTPRPSPVPQSTLRERGYTACRELGFGSQGEIWLCTRGRSLPWPLPQPQKFCVKFIHKIHELMDEYELMRKLDHPNVAKTHEVFHDDDHYYLVSELYTGGTLARLGRNAHDAGVGMSEGWWRGIFRPSCTATSRRPTSCSPPATTGLRGPCS